MREWTMSRTFLLHYVSNTNTIASWKCWKNIHSYRLTNVLSPLLKPAFSYFKETSDSTAHAATPEIPHSPSPSQKSPAKDLASPSRPAAHKTPHVRSHQSLVQQSIRHSSARQRNRTCACNSALAAKTADRNDRKPSSSSSSSHL